MKLIILILLIFALGCTKEEQPEPLKIFSAIKTIEDLHTDSLLKSGKLTLGDPKFITTRPTGDRLTYDYYYGLDKNGRVTEAYIKQSNWLVSMVYENKDKSCRTLYFWRHGKLIQLLNPSKEEFDSPTYQLGEIVEGETLLKLMKKYGK